MDEQMPRLTLLDCAPIEARSLFNKLQHDFLDRLEVGSLQITASVEKERREPYRRHTPDGRAQRPAIDPGSELRREETSEARERTAGLDGQTQGR
jgi:hypothetical protein